jgi:hypothetical protein
MKESEIVDFVRQSEEAEKRQKDCARERGPWCDYPWPLQMPNPLPWGWLALWLVGGPIGALVLGAACFWIGEGFRRPKGLKRNLIYEATRRAQDVFVHGVHEQTTTNKHKQTHCLEQQVASDGD